MPTTSGVTRPQAAGCDLGVVEAVVEAPVDTTTTTTAPAVPAGEALARTGQQSWLLSRYGFALIGVGTLLVLKRPYGKHYRKRAR